MEGYVEGTQARRPAQRWETGPGGGSVASTVGGPVGSAGAYFKPGRALHRPLCETVGYARRAAANSRLVAYRRKEKWNAAQWCGRARRRYTPATSVKCSQCHVSAASRTLELCCASPTSIAGLF